MANDKKFGNKNGGRRDFKGGNGAYGNQGKRSFDGERAPKKAPVKNTHDDEMETELYRDESTLNTENAVAGRNAVAELVRSGRDVDKIFVKDGEWEGAIKDIVALAKERGIPVVEAGKQKLDKLCGGVTHQGIVAIAAEK